MAPGVEEKLVEVVNEAARQLLVWEETRAKRCADCQQLGVLASYPECVTRLEVKITQSAERARRYVERDKARMAEVVQRLKDISRQCQKLFEDAVELRGIDAVNRETPESFALSRYPSWLKELHSTYNLDTAGKLSALEQLRYSSACVQAVRDRWEVQPGPQDILQCLHYVARTKSS
ncbi:hypothetical protein EMCRGX_G030907 [Ephydatia muelleri]